jgi:hypothetical protein
MLINVEEPSYVTYLRNLKKKNHDWLWVKIIIQLFYNKIMFILKIQI